MAMSYLRREEELQRALLEIKLHQQGHIVTHVERDLACERSGFGEVREVFQGECE